jgi:hypothetical protein
MGKGRGAAHGLDWTEEQDATLRRLAAERYSSGKAAQEMGKTRSAVMGRAKRLGVTFQGLRDKKHSLRAKAPTFKPGVLPKELADPATTVPVPIWLLTENRCRWPLWLHMSRPTPESLYCGLSTSGRRYCEHHRHRAYNDVVDDPPAS